MVDKQEDNNDNADIDVVGKQEDNNADIDVSMDIDASADEPEIMQSTTIVDFDIGDAIGKLLAFVNQVRMSSEGVREYLVNACSVHSVKPIEPRLWVCTRWGSLSDCLEVTLSVRKVSPIPDFYRSV